MVRYDHTITFKYALILALCCLPLISIYAAVTIPEVDLTLEKTDAEKEEERVQTTTITRKRIEASPATTFGDLLQREQSIARVLNNSNDNSQPVISIRGFGDNAFANTLIVIDGFPMTNPSILAPSLNAVSLVDILKISILQGSEGSLWGNQAVGGVVKIDTLRPERLLGSANISYGNYNSQIYNILIGNKFKNGIFFKLSGFANTTDNYRAHNQQRNQNLSFQTGLDYESGSLTLNAKIFDDMVQLPGILTEAQYSSNPRQASNFTNFSQYQTNIYQLIHKQVLTDDWLLETRLSHNKIRGDGIVTAPFTRQDLLNTFNPRLMGTVCGSKVIVGYERQDSNFQLQGGVSQQADVSQNDVYAQVIVPFASKLDFTLGGRSAWQDNTLIRSFRPANQSPDPFDVSYRVFVSEQGLSYRPSLAWTFFLRRDGNFRFPKANEQTTLPVALGTLLPQTGVSYEGGAKWQGVRHMAQLSLYRLALNNEIAYNPTQTPNAPGGSFSNFPETLRHGVTLTDRYKLTEKLALNGQINYVDARFAGGSVNNNFIPAVPAWNGNIGVDYQFLPHWHAKYVALYTGSRYPSQDINNIAQQLPGYWLSAVTLQYLRKPLNLSLDVENLFNQRYPVFVVLNRVNQTRTFFPGMGRSIFLTAKVFLD